jgi:signal transduction histidine kinase
MSISNWPVATRLVAVFVVASIAGLVFGGLRIANAVRTSDAYSKTAQLATLGQHLTVLAQDLEDERDLTAGVAAYQTLATAATVAKASAVVAHPIIASLASQEKVLATAQQQTNAAIAQAAPLTAAIGSSFPTIVQADAASVISMIAGINGLRQGASGQTAGVVISDYTSAIANLLVLNDEITALSGDALLAQEVRALGALSRAKDQASQQRAMLYSALIEATVNDAGTAKKPSSTLGPQSLNDAGGLSALTGVRGTEAADLAAFNEAADLAAFGDTQTPSLPSVSQTQAITSQTARTQLIVDSVAAAADPRITFEPIAGQIPLDYSRATVAGIWYADMTAIVENMRQIETVAMNDIVTRSQALQHDAANSALLTAVVTVGAVLVVLIATALVGRSLVNPLRRLRTDALDIAAVRLPSRVAAAAEGTDLDAGAEEIEPIAVSSTDEIGQVARAFDQVHAEAVRLAGTEARLRGSLSAMFISLSRRSVPLIDRLARMIDGMEQHEDDPDLLGNLFAMDHLITRMRRNSENLLVLAGEEPVRKWSESVPLSDVTRAAAAEIEQYNRVVLSAQPGVMVSGQAAADVVHLLAELIENATLFSPQTTQVRVTVMELSTGGVLVEVRDDGVGVPQARMAEMNWRLEHPPALDVSVSRHMGLYAVAHLAARHGIRVKLRPGVPNGLSALVWLPGALARQERAATPSYSLSIGAAQSLGPVTARRPPAVGRGDVSRRPGRASAEQPRLRDRGFRSGRSTTAWFAAKRPSSGALGPAEQFAADWQPVTGARVPGTGPVPGGYDSAADSLVDSFGPQTSAGLPRRTPRSGSYPGTDMAASGLAAQGAPLLGAPAGGPADPPPTHHQEPSYPAYQEASYPAAPHQDVALPDLPYADDPYLGDPYQGDPYQGDPYQETQHREAMVTEVQPSQLPTRRRSPEAVRERLTGFQLGSRDGTAGGPYLGAGQREAPGQGTESGQLPTRRRSPEAVRDRLTGFQLGSQDALLAGPEHRQQPPAGEENSR